MKSNSVDEMIATLVSLPNDITDETMDALIARPLIMAGFEAGLRTNPYVVTDGGWLDVPFPEDTKT